MFDGLHCANILIIGLILSIFVVCSPDGAGASWSYDDRHGKFIFIYIEYSNPSGIIFSVGSR